MVIARQFDKAWMLRALMDSEALNVMLSLYCGSQQSRNCLVICQQVSDAAPGSKLDRARLYHSKEVAIPFRYEYGQWWWGDEGKQRW